ncbi:restriction endonuclease, type II-like superfamily protein isoform X2 [Wolffia australiana]
MLPFHEQIVAELLEEEGGGLVVLSAGLSYQTLVCALLRLHSPIQGTLLILSASDHQRSSILQCLRRESIDSRASSVAIGAITAIPSEIPGDLPAQHRVSRYSSGAAFFVSPRILIADLLTSRCPASSLAGIVILNAHQLSETSTESFIVRVVRGANKKAYVRAISDSPQGMVSGFAKAERTMRWLGVRRLHLWPRFQVQVAADLEAGPPEVVNVQVPMTGAMRGIQSAVLGAMDACLKELRLSNKVDVEDLTVENGLFKSFDEIVRRQLDPIWHTLGMKTKQLVADLRTLRKLADYLVRYDAVTYLKYLDTLRVSEGIRSVWIFADTSHKIFEFAKKRVYQVIREDGSKVADVPGNGTKRKRHKGHKKEDNAGNSVNGSEVGAVLKEVLEEAPKWRVLRELLEEIEEERQKNVISEDHEINKGNHDSGIVLVVCKDERSCMQLEEFIERGSKKVMQAEWEKYVLDRVELFGLRKKNKVSSNPEGFGVLNGEVPAGGGDNLKLSSINQVENEALLAIASGITNFSEVTAATPNSNSPAGMVRGRKGKVAKGKAKVNIKGTLKSTLSAEHNVSEVGLVENQGDETSSESVMLVDSVDKILPPVQLYALESRQDILHNLKPSTIIIYHPDVRFVREIEVYQAENPSKKLKVYFLLYEDSTEAQKFEACVRRENSAFESLIRQKSLMMIPIDQSIGPSPFKDGKSLSSQNSVTRRAGGRIVPEKEMRVIVDMREFMSSLPNVLHQKGMRVIPLTLEVGDYILSPSICVERKSVMDLFQSFSSGRLYHQVETMVRYYPTPVLLIEFSQDKCFSFQSASDIGCDISPTNIISKLSLLVLHFPRLRLVWSRSVHATAEVFASLKANQDEPDEEKAARVGIPSEDGIIEDDARAENYNTSAIEFLRRLPGVTDSNYRAIMDGCKSLAELAVLPVERLAVLMGGQKAARTLREFLDAKCPTML